MFVFLLLSLNSWAEQIRYVKSVSLSLKSETSSVIFGSPAIGYFETNELKKTKDSFELKILLPSYLNPIEFYEKRDPLRRLFRRKFSNPTPKEHTLESVTLKGTLVTRLFLTNGYTPFEPADEKEPKGHSVVFVLN